MSTFFLTNVDFLSHYKMSDSLEENDHNQLDVIHHLTSVAHYYFFLVSKRQNIVINFLNLILSIVCLLDNTGGDW